MAAAGHGADRPAPRPRLARTLNDTLKDMPAARLPRPSLPPPQEVTTMTMTEPRFPVRITRGVPVVIAPDEIDITNAEALRAACSTPPPAPARPWWST